jgi:dihydroorotase
MYCLPVAKRERHRLALRAAATGGDHVLLSRHRFRAASGGGQGNRLRLRRHLQCAVTAIELYAQVFDEEGALDRLEAFASLNGPAFYGLPTNGDTVTLTLARAPRAVEEAVPVEGADAVQLFRAGETLRWSVVA